MKKQCLWLPWASKLSFPLPQPWKWGNIWYPRLDGRHDIRKEHAKLIVHAWQGEQTSNDGNATEIDVGSARKMKESNQPRYSSPEFAGHQPPAPHMNIFASRFPPTVF